jgi:hypothetical protein
MSSWTNMQFHKTCIYFTQKDILVQSHEVISAELQEEGKIYIP